MITVGVVIDVPEPIAGTITVARRSWGDPEADIIPPHVTLVAPVSLDPEALPAVEEHIARACAGAEPFRVRLRGTATFRPVSPVVFLPLAEGISGCELLETALRTGPLAIDLRFPYHPHVTIAAELAEDALDQAFVALAGFDEHFSVDRVALYSLEPTGWVRRREYTVGAA